jgi:hypothetical protein
VTAPPPLNPPPPQLTPEHLNQLTAARERLKKVRRAISVAKFDGWSVAIFGAFTAVLSIPNIVGILLGIGMGAVAYVELSNAERVRKLEPDALKTMGINQLAFAGGLILYAIYSLLTMGKDVGADLSSVGSLDPSTLQTAGNLARMIMILVYGTLILVAIFGQGSLALYYFSRRKLLEKYKEETPPWIIAMQEAGVSL